MRWPHAFAAVSDSIATLLADGGKSSDAVIQEGILDAVKGRNITELRASVLQLILTRSPDGRITRIGEPSHNHVSHHPC